MLLRGGEMKKIYGITAETIYKNDGRNTVVRPSDCVV